MPTPVIPVDKAKAMDSAPSERQATATEEVRFIRTMSADQPLELGGDRVVVFHVAINNVTGARAAFGEIEDRHGIHDRVGSDGSPRGLGIGGPPEAVADFVRPYADLGIDEVIWIFRDPFDLETIARMPEVRTLLA